MSIALVVRMSEPTCQSVPRFLLVLGFVGALSPAPASACTIVIGLPTLVGQPADEAQAVPTNVVLHYLVPSNTLAFSDQYTLLSASGEQVPLVVTRPASSLLALTPQQPLQPNTAYTLAAHWKLAEGGEADTALTFGTGDGPSDAAPPPPAAVLRGYEMNPPSHSCAPPKAGSCVSVQDDTSLIEYTLIDESGVASGPSFRRGSSFFGELRAHFSCVEVRQFAANGARSQPLRLCADEAPVLDITGMEGEPDVGCSAAGLEWCVSSGRSGLEPGPADPRGADGAVFCAPDPLVASTASAQRAEAAAGSGLGAPGPHAEPAADGCSVTAVRSEGPHWSLMAIVAGFGLRLARRRKGRA